MILFVF